MTEVVHATQDWVNTTVQAALAALPQPEPGAGGAVLTSPDGRRWRQVVDNSGVLTVVQTDEPGPPAVPTNPVLEDAS